ncbi:MAG: DegQ family serine endoprotease [Alphaproteobacteria bacterium]|nr:DegQ family serine endoprotease [Alphaproteobacteria bacterium]
MRAKAKYDRTVARMRFMAGMLLLAAGLGAAPALAESKAVPSSRQQVELSFAPLVKQVAPAVVNIYTKTEVRQPISPLFNDPFFQRFFGDEFFGGPDRKRIQNSLGSGVIIDPGGLIVTNHHVVADADEITVILSDRNEFEAEVVQTDKRTDLAVLRIGTGGRKVPALELRDADELEVGDLVLAIGNPFGVGKTVTSGIVSALARTNVGISDFRSFIQTDAAINPGNSGGALVSMDGKLVGINTAIFSRSGGSIGLGFAVPSNMVATVVAAAKGGKLVRPWFGATAQNVTAEIAASLGLERPQGVLLSEIYPNGPADRAGLEVGDIVAAINRREIMDAQELRFRFATLPVGGAADLSIIRMGDTMDKSLALEAPPEIPPRNTTTLGGRSPLAGATVANLSPALAEEIGADLTLEGVIVLGVERGSPAHRFRLQRGDTVVELNGKSVTSVRILEELTSTRGRVWELTMRRKGRPYRIAVRG